MKKDEDLSKLRIRQYFLADPYKKKTKEKLLGYLIIPVWIMGCIATTIFLGIVYIIASIKRLITKKEVKPYFKIRPIFPEDTDNFTE
jgi:hypothetical protein